MCTQIEDTAATKAPLSSNGSERQRKEGRKDGGKKGSKCAGGRAAGRLEGRQVGSGQKRWWAAGRKEDGQTGTLGTQKKTFIQFAGDF
jgi:hypothetical protein